MARVYATEEIRRERVYQRAEQLEKEMAPQVWKTPGLTIGDLEVIADAWEEASFFGWADNYRAEAARRRGTTARDPRRRQASAHHARLYQIRVDIYEAATDYRYPVVTHLFHGKTRAEAKGYHDAHRKSDVFLRSCEDRGVFQRSVRCRAVKSEGWVERK